MQGCNGRYRRRLPCKMALNCQIYKRGAKFNAFLPPPPRSIMQPSGADLNGLPSPPWGIPVNITVPRNADGQPITPWNRLRFSPMGAYHLRCWQGVFPGIKDFFVTCQSRFRSADISWFASGANRDGNHAHSSSSFHPSLVMLYKDTNSPLAKAERKALLAEVKEHLFDLVILF